MNFDSMSAVKRFLEIESGERRALLAASLLVPAVRIALWVLPSSTIVQNVRQLTAKPVTPKAAGALHPRTIVWAIEAVSRRVPSASCLTQAVSAQLLLRRYGYSSELCVGVNRTATGSFRAHAWLLRDGKVLLGGDPTDYTVLSGFQPRPSIPSGSR